MGWHNLIYNWRFTFVSEGDWKGFHYRVSERGQVRPLGINHNWHYWDCGIENKEHFERVLISSWKVIEIDRKTVRTEWDLLITVKGK